MPDHVRGADGEALALAAAENVIRADLNPVEDARVYRRLLDEHADAATVARLVGESVRRVAERLDLLRLHAEATEALMRAKTPEAALAVILRPLVAQRVADPEGLSNADRARRSPAVLPRSDRVDRRRRREARHARPCRSLRAPMGQSSRRPDEAD
jgi:ParB-like chromosome segregation protein Spo0J